MLIKLLLVNRKKGDYNEIWGSNIFKVKKEEKSTEKRKNLKILYFSEGN